MLDQAKAFLDESDALFRLLDPLPEAELDRTTAFKDWTIDNVLGHLHMLNHAANLALNDAEAFGGFAAGLVKNAKAGNPLRVFEADWLGDLRGRALLSTWRDFAGEVADRFDRSDPSHRVKWFGPDMSVRSSITARFMETWAHGQEVYDLLGVARVNEDRIRNVVVLGVNTYGWTFKNRREEPPQPAPHLRLIAPSGALWTYNDASETELIEGPAEAFCQVVTQVRNIADTTLAVTGPNAAAWMSKAQCFAGPPQDPPAPGTRKTADAVATPIQA